VQRRACYLALGVSVDGDRDVLGMWFQETEGAKFWMQVLNDLKHRGVQAILICCVDGLKGFPRRSRRSSPQDHGADVHRASHPPHSLRYVPRREREQVARDLKAIYTAIDADAAQLELEAFDEKWGQRFPVITQAWLTACEHVISFLAFPAEVRRVIYTRDEDVKAPAGSTVTRSGVRLGCGRGRPPSEAQDLGLMPAAQLLPRLRALRVAPAWIGTSRAFRSSSSAPSSSVRSRTKTSAGRIATSRLGDMHPHSPPESFGSNASGRPSSRVRVRPSRRAAGRRREA
jgi:hypothetical protein